MRTNRPYVQIDPDVLERVRQIDLLSYLREFEPSNLVNLNGTADVKATFTAEGRKKNCIIKLEEIEKISSVHREKNEDNAHFIKNPHIFTYLHRLLLHRRSNSCKV